MRGADDDDVLRDDWRGVQADFAGDWIDRLIVLELQIDRCRSYRNPKRERRSSRRARASDSPGVT
jgi:hypothetical protein